MPRTAARWGWTALALLCAAAESADEAALAQPDQGARPDLVVLWSDPQRSISEAMRRDVAQETEALFSRWGVALRTSWAADREEGPGRQVRVVLLDKRQLTANGKRVLGQTHVQPLEFPAVWILVPNVREVLEHGRWGDSPPVLARALARVAAHEMLHALGLGHAPKGLMRCGLGAADLTRPWVEVSRGFERALVDALRPGGAPAVLGSP